MASFFKITAPNPSGIIRRERLFRLLDRSFCRSIVWIEGPAGSGKTSLVSSYLNARHLPHLWYRIDAGDADISSFFYYLGVGAKTAAPRFRKPLPLLTPEYILGIPVFTQRYFEELYRRLKPPFVIVLDDFQDAPPQSKLHEIVHIGLSALPEGIHVVVLSRTPIPQELVRLRANNRVSLIGWKDLRLRPEETREILRSRVEGEITGEALSFLQEKTEGWVVGLMLFVENAELHDFDYRMPETLTPGEVFDYFANEIFHKADQPVQRFLLKTAFLPSMTGSMAESLTGFREAGPILESLARNHYFTEKRLDESSSYLYHPLFREFLLSKAQETLAPDELQDAQQRSAKLLIEAGQVDEAVALLAQARDWNSLVPLVLQQAPFLVSQGRGRTLDRWIGSVPEEIIGDNPWLLYWKGVCILPFAPIESRNHFQRAFELFNGASIEAGALLAWSGAVQTYLFEFHDFRPLDEWIDWLDSRMSGNLSFPSTEIGVSVAAGMVGALAWRRPNHPEARKWVNTALSLAQETSNVDAALRAFTNSAFYFLWMGEFADCSVLVEDMRKLARSRAPSPSRLITLKVAEAMFYNSLSEHHEQAIQAVLDGMEIAEETGVHVFDPTLLIQALYSAFNAGDLKRVKELLLKMEPFLGSRCTNQSYFSYFSAWHHLLRGNRSRALVSARKSLQLIEEAGVPISEGLIRLLMVQLLQDSQDDGGALAQLQAAGRLAEESGSPYLRYLYDMIAAVVAFSREKEEHGLQCLRRGLGLGREMGYTTLIHFWRPGVMSRLCLKALEAGIETEHVRVLVRKLDLVPDVPPLEVESWPWPVRIYTLGRFALIIKGEPVEKPSKAQKKPLLLLKALIALGGRDIKEEHLVDILWPDASGDAGHNAFTTTLARLRKMLGDERAVHLHDGRVSLDNRLCWVDRWLFERLCGVALDLLEKRRGREASAELGRAAARAAALYHGHFLKADADEHWTVEARERIRSKYLRLMGAIARFAQETGDDEEALLYYRKGLESDPLAEEFYQGLLEVFIRLGRHAEALRVYRRCRQTLNAELGIGPSPKTEGLRKKIPVPSR